MPEKLFEAEPGATDDDKAKAFAEHPVGSGPFAFASWARGSDMKLVANKYYWDKGEDGKPLPYLDGIDFPVVPDDATRILQLQSGALQGAEFIPYSRVDELKQSANLNMQLFPSTRVEYVSMNVRPQISGQDNPLSKPEVRQALNYATNKDAIIQIVTHGVGTVPTSFMSKATPLHSGDTPLWPYDLDKAKQLLSQAGLPNGFTLTLLVLAGNQDQIGIATALQQMWSQIGVTLNLQQEDNPTITSQYRAGTFQMRLAAWTDDIADPNEITSYFVYSPNIQALHSGWQNATPTSCSSRARARRTRPSARTNTPRFRRSTTRPAPSCRSTKRAIGGAEQECAGLRADSARQQHLPRRLAAEVSWAAGGP